MLVLGVLAGVISKSGNPAPKFNEGRLKHALEDYEILGSPCEARDEEPLGVTEL